jgi:hypothetical protein
MIVEAVQQWLATRPVVAGEIVHAGWLVFRVASEGPPIVLESLDFKNIASFTKDLSEAESIFEMQANALRKNSAEEEPCTLRHTAVVSRSYTPGHPKAFIKRDTPAKESDSGWYVGILDDHLDINDPKSFVAQSLYEISIADRRVLPYWLMPVDTLVAVESGVVA